MSDPVLHLVVGPNGSGKSTFHARALGPLIDLPFVNADVIAAQRWPDTADAHGYNAAELAAVERTRLIAERSSFAAESVFSHPSKLAMLQDARVAGFLVTLHILLVPVELTVARVEDRVGNGGHPVPEAKIRERFARLWRLVAEGIEPADDATVYDNSRAANPFSVTARYRGGRLVGTPVWPRWTPGELRAAGR